LTYDFIFIDTIVEAKNGTGKTLTFVIPTLIRLKLEQVHLQTIILAPTREIAVQIQQCFKKVGQHLPGTFKKTLFFSKVDYKTITRLYLSVYMPILSK